MLFLKLLKSLVFNQTEKDASEISDALFNMDEFKSLVAAELYFQKPIGSSNKCLTAAEMVESAFLNGLDQHAKKHLQECEACSSMFEAVQTEMKEAEKLSQTLETVGQEFRKITKSVTDFRDLQTYFRDQINHLSKNLSDWDLLKVADRYNWPSQAVTCLPTLYFPNETNTPVVWRKLLPFIPTEATNYKTLNEFCKGEVVKISVPKKVTPMIDRVATALDEVRLANPFGSERAFKGVINQSINDFEVWARSEGHTEIANRVRKKRQEFLVTDVSIKLN